jgi:hypothetical protein
MGLDNRWKYAILQAEGKIQGAGDVGEIQIAA